MVENRLMPQNEFKLNNSFNKCKSKFVKVESNFFSYYLEEAYSDLHSAEKELKDGSEKWAVTKAYQALFLIINALLVRYCGYYSKDHGCAIIALLKEKVISSDISAKLIVILKEKEKIYSALKTKDDIFEEISNLRVIRNKYLYLPKTLRKLDTSATGIVEEVKELMKVLSEKL